ncbi:MAG: carcinine hydrolase/isopenicillin-N N-acyltransferase family protein [Candidatus Hermodarchaeota archaeon]
MRLLISKKYILLIYILIGLFPFPFILDKITPTPYTNQNTYNSNNPPHSYKNTCTVFTVTSEDDDKVYFCNNEDYFPNHMRMYFFPASEGKYGKVLYGFTYQHGFNPLGGMNEKGLSADENWVPSTPVDRDSDKRDYNKNNFFTKALEKCATVEDVIEYVEKFNLIYLESYPCQTHYADKTGDAAIIGVAKDGDIAITRKNNASYLLSTNFNVAHGRKPCWRYDLAKKELENMDDDDVSKENCLSILKATKQGKWTRYSNINDLRKKKLYFYTSLTDYKGIAIVDLKKELAKGFHSYDILTLITRRGEVSPSPIFIASSIIVLATIVAGCVLIWIRKIKPEIIKAKNSVEKRNGLNKGEYNEK